MFGLCSLLLLASTQATTPGLEISSPALLQAYGSLRAEAEAPDAAGQTAEFRNLVSKLDSGPDPARARSTAMTLVDSFIVTCPGPDDLDKAISKLPDDWKRGNLTKSWLKDAAGLVSTYFAAYSAPADLSDQLRKKGEEIKKGFAKPWVWLADKLGVEEPPKTIDVILLPRFAWPGAVTLWTSAGVKVVLSTELDGSNLLELALHESIHACEAGGGKVDVLAQIRGSEKVKALPPRDRQNLPHALYFVAAADALRHTDWKDHKDYGITKGAYERGLEPYRKHIEPLWRDYVAGKISREEFVAKVTEFKASGLH